MFVAYISNLYYCFYILLILQFACVYQYFNFVYSLQTVLFIFFIHFGVFFILLLSLYYFCSLSSCVSLCSYTSHCSNVFFTYYFHHLLFLLNTSLAHNERRLLCSVSCNNLSAYNDAKTSTSRSCNRNPRNSELSSVRKQRLLLR